MLNLRAVALQGVGFGAALLAFQGFIAEPVPDHSCLSARAIAVQGIGFGGRLTAIQGFACPGESVTKPGDRGNKRPLPGFLAQAREEDEILMAMLHTIVWEL